MKILQDLPPFTGEWLKISEVGLPPMHEHVWVAGSIVGSNGEWLRATKEAYWLKWEEEDDVGWYIAGPDSYSICHVEEFMVLPPLPENTGERAYLRQYTAENCPGRPCSEDCDHRGIAPSVT